MIAAVRELRRFAAFVAGDRLRTLKKDTSGHWLIFSDMDNPNRPNRRP